MSSSMISQTSRQMYLSDDELDLLDNWLDELSLDLDDSLLVTRFPLSLASVDGLFAALALSPRNTSIGDWMRLVMGDASFAEKDRVQTCRNLLIRHYHSVVHAFRKTDLEDYYPCVTPCDDIDDNCVDISGWCVGFAVGYEQQQDGWDACLDEMSLSDLNLILAFKDQDSLNEAESDSELCFRQAQAGLIEVMRHEVGLLLDDEADDLSLLLFVLKGLQDRMLSAESLEKNNSKKSQSKSQPKHQSKNKSYQPKVK